MGGDYITFKYRYRKQIIIISIILIIIATSGYLLFINYKPKVKKDVEIIANDTPKKNNSTEETKVTNLLKVDIKGEINNPGIYELKESSRVIDVIEKAGGLTPNANTTVINLSKKITDEMVIIIYSNQQVEEFSKTKEIEEQLQTNCINANDQGIKNDACITKNTQVEEDKESIKISINKATLEELQTLPGIGEEKAKNIIKYREKNGNFTSIEDLRKVTGIGESIFAKIKENITL